MRDYKKEAIDYANRYNQKNYKQFVFRVRKDDPVIQHLKKQKSIAGYIVNLIKEDMKKEG